MPNARHLAQDLPADYPSSYESVMRLADGRRVKIRPILPSDAPELAEAIRTADAETLRARFLGGPPPLTDATLHTLTRVDYRSRFALAAFSQGRGVAIARYAAPPPSGSGSVVADVAVAVAPEWRRVGLSTVLVERLARRAQECGITHFTALFSAENRPVTKLAHEGNARVVIAQGVAELDAALTSPHPDGPINDRWEDPAPVAEGRDPVIAG
ncbi:MAG TPA: GNAT family N-acetyltransferase [Dermatophilaceae bacterium]